MKYKWMALLTIAIGVMLLLTACGATDTGNAALGATGTPSADQASAAPTASAQPSTPTKAPEDTPTPSSKPTETAPEVTQTPTPTPANPGLPITTPLELVFSSGAGGWGTAITLNPDGSFTGSYHDSEMGDLDETKYPNGTVYVCNFSGRFEDIQQQDAHTYAMTLGQLEMDKPKEETWIEEGIRYIAADPYGLESGKTFRLYLPETPLAGLSEEFLSWWPGRFTGDADTKTTLSCYGLHNVEMEYGFFN